MKSALFLPLAAHVLYLSERMSSDMVRVIDVDCFPSPQLDLLLEGLLQHSTLQHCQLIPTNCMRACHDDAGLMHYTAICACLIQHPQLHIVEYCELVLHCFTFTTTNIITNADKGIFEAAIWSFAGMHPCLFAGIVRERLSMGC